METGGEDEGEGQGEEGGLRKLGSPWQCSVLIG